MAFPNCTRVLLLGGCSSFYDFDKGAVDHTTVNSETWKNIFDRNFADVTYRLASVIDEDSLSWVLYSELFMNYLSLNYSYLFTFYGRPFTCNCSYRPHLAGQFPERSSRDTAPLSLCYESRLARFESALNRAVSFHQQFPKVQPFCLISSQLTWHSRPGSNRR